MESLAAPLTLRRAALAALLTTLACLPKLASGMPALHPLWFSALTVALTSAVMWAFVFAWEETRLGRAPFSRPSDPRLWLAATVLAVLVAAYRALVLDPALVARGLGQRPGSAGDWAAAGLFQLAFLQPFALFAPVALCARLARSRVPAYLLVVGLGLYIVGRLLERQSDSVSAVLAAQILLGRAVADALAVWFYLRGGVLVMWWMGLVLHLRHLPALLTGA